MENEIISSGSSEAPDVTTNEDGTVTVKIIPPPEQMPEEAFNLVQHFTQTDEGKKVLKKLAEEVIGNVGIDWDATEPYRSRRRTRLKLLSGELDSKQAPYEDCANVHVPVMLERILRYVARIYREIFPSRDYVFRAITPGDKNKERAEILTAHGNHQIRKEIPDFFKQMRRALMEFATNGDVVVHSSRDITGNRNHHECLNCEEFVFPYVWKTTAIDMSDVPRKTRLLRKYKHELRALERRGGVYSDIDRVCKEGASHDTGLDLKISEVVDKIEGRSAPADGKTAPYLLYEYHGWHKLPGQEEERPIVATVEPRTQTVIGLYLREEDDPKDALRFDNELALIQRYTDEMQNFQALMAAEQEVRMRLSMPDVPFEERAQLEQVLAEQAPLAPEPPEIVTTGKVLTDPTTGAMTPRPVTKRAIEY
ncbi:MAG: hypothetical protein M3Q61_05505, partial [Chloroflexota bacterium]|nr:hypothetical protein [Chloroflexota bacterium]